MPPVIQHLNGDSIRMSAGDVGYLDVNGDAVLDDGGLDFLDIFLNSSSPDDVSLGIDVAGNIVLSNGVAVGSTISVRLPDMTLVAIGVIDAGSNANALHLGIAFNANATSALIGELLHALTYVNTSLDADLVALDEIQLYATRNGESELFGVTVTVAPADMLILTPGTDLLVGTAQADKLSGAEYAFSISDQLDGGGGIDTLQLLGDGGQSYFKISQLNQFARIENIYGTDGVDGIQIRGDQLVDVGTIDGKGGDNYLWIAGATTADLTGKTIANFAKIGLSDDGVTIKTDSLAVALIVNGQSSDGDTLILTVDELTQADRTTLHNKGVDTITAIDADTHQIKTTTARAPRITELNGDHVSHGGAPVFLDAGRNATVEADAKLSYLDIHVGEGRKESDKLGIDTTGSVTLSGGLAMGSTVRVGTTEIGVLDYVDGGTLIISFDDNANPALVQDVIHALTFTNTAGAISESRTIHIYAGDLSGREAHLTLNVDAGTASNHTPTGIILSGLSIDELATAGSPVGTLSTQDPDQGNTFAYTLLDDAGGRFALKDGRIVVADGIKLDYEQARSHTITVRSTDQGGLSVDKTFTIQVNDAAREVTSGSDRDDKIVAGGGNDSLGGGLGNDTLFGGTGTTPSRAGSATTASRAGWATTS